jgi:hypothetical protein
VELTDIILIVLGIACAIIAIYNLGYLHCEEDHEKDWAEVLTDPGPDPTPVERTPDRDF